ncbi:MAG: NAD(P)-binding domain-containing protein [Deltaproteobacteria bacterium]|nr:NAD(P)-binding domain-containing protein [Deltaproteobacteria bacterium]
MTTTTSSPKVAVLGAGKLGAAVTGLLASAGARVALWARRPEASAAVQQTAGKGVDVAATIADAVRGAQLMCFAVPVDALREVARAAGDVTTGDQIALHACRGVETGFVLPSEVLREETCLKQIGALGGPLYLDDAAHGRPLVAAVGARFDDVFRAVRLLTKNTRVRVHATHDLVGVELCGAISNVAQLAAGMAEGAGLGETDQGTLLVRGLAEAAQLGAARGAEAATFLGIAGVGDLIPRQVTSTRRNRHLGREIGQGTAAARAMTAHTALEGPVTAREARTLGDRLGLKLPLIQAVDDVLWRGAAPAEALERVLALDLSLSF